MDVGEGQLAARAPDGRFVRPPACHRLRISDRIEFDKLRRLRRFGCPGK